ncbi:MAG: xanthine dehydrogenase family protein molybdopterin-binding subunit [Candidatus Aminicenantes bacterium]|jgi:xanthine dehydrogenase YagR molybdenum-binding subunit
MAKKDHWENTTDPHRLYTDEVRSEGTTTQEAPSAEQRSDFRIIGKQTSRIDGRKIVTGKAPYLNDLRLRGLLIGKILRSPHPHAEIASIDLTKAKNLPGVKAAIELDNKKVQFIGNRVAAVAAIDDQTAEKALKLIKVEYKPLPYVVSVEKSREEGAPQVHEKRPNVEKVRDEKRGDVEVGFKEADVVLERNYRTPIEIHHPAETHGSIAKWEGDRLIVWDSTQAIHNVRNGLARSLGIPTGRVTVIKRYMGGGFGSKLGLNAHTVIAAQLARETGRPVKIMLTRKENSLCVGNRPTSLQTYKGGVKKDGSLTAISLRNYTTGGVNRGDRCSEPLLDVYKCPNLQVKEYTVYTNMGGSRAMRAPGHVQGTFGLEGFLDELSYSIGMDPLELRKKNYTTKNRGDTGVPYSSKGLDKCYDLGAEKIGWHRRNTIPGEGKGKIRRGLGMASQIWWGAGVPETLADVKIYRDGGVDVICGTQDIGCGTRTHMAVVAADTLGLDPQDITIKLGNSDYPWAPLSGGSLTTPSVAPAVRDASLKAAAHLKQMAAEKLKVSAQDIRLQDKKFFEMDNPENAISFKELARELRRETVFHGERKGLPEGFAYNSFGAHFVEVEVDTDTGIIKVIKVVAAHDSGQIINTKTAESQVIGGVTQGVSATLFEQRIVDDTTGTLVNPNWRDYKIATSMDIPEITPIFVDVDDPRINILGTKGLGEPPRIPIAAAIGNAVYNAIGVHVREIPMTPDKVLTALERKEAS